MQFARITPAYAVAPQIEPGDAVALAAAGFTDVICNRPDAEVPETLAAHAIEAAAVAAGLGFHRNPVISGGLSAAEVTRQADLLAAATGPVLAYCRSGTRSAVVWALGETAMTRDEIVSAAGRAGYDLGGLPIAGRREGA